MSLRALAALTRTPAADPNPAPGECPTCLTPMPCGHVTVIDGDRREWVLTAREFAGLTKPLPASWTTTTKDA